jgi:hypothetical protein
LRGITHGRIQKRPPRSMASESMADAESPRRELWCTVNHLHHLSVVLSMVELVQVHEALVVVLLVCLFLHGQTDGQTDTPRPHQPLP